MSVKDSKSGSKVKFASCSVLMEMNHCHITMSGVLNCIKPSLGFKFRGSVEDSFKFR